MPPAEKHLCIYVFFGLIASGKSTLAKKWAKQHKMLYYSSDLIRKELAGLAPQESGSSSFRQGIYSEDFTDKTYSALHEKGAAELVHGRSVVLDASYSSMQQRRQAEILAQKYMARSWFIHCTCSEAETIRRLAARAQDPTAVSDGSLEIYEKQKDIFDPVDQTKNNLTTISTMEPPESLVVLLEKQLAKAQKAL